MDSGTAKEQALFAAALEIAQPAEREQFLEQSCRGDAELRRALTQLLAAHAKSERLFSPGVSRLVTEAGAELRGMALGDVALPAAEAIGACIGRYRIVQLLGEGGCGLVYLAEQEQPVRRQVALKVIKSGMDTRSVIARFEAERQALARMDHPNIAKVLDAGATNQGRPFCVMELVPGV
ncbi:MAG TPA: protein kinase, partial [Candidatus Sulfotelmatobacter sp.]|nr:protein kinase [Candidatus Sulfotelmatobacter sp.]